MKFIRSYDEDCKNAFCEFPPSSKSSTRWKLSMSMIIFASLDIFYSDFLKEIPVLEKAQFFNFFKLLFGNDMVLLWVGLDLAGKELTNVEIYLSNKTR